MVEEFHARLQIVLSSHLFFFFNFYIYIYFLLFHNVELSLRRGYEAERHLKAFEQISSAQSPTQTVPLEWLHILLLT